MKKIITIAAIATLAGCATGPRVPEIRGNVIPMENNFYQVTSMDGDLNNANKKALESAEAVCLERKMRHIVSSKKQEYKGPYGTEAARDIIDYQNRTIAALRKQAYIPPFYERRNDYHVTVEFSCTT